MKERITKDFIAAMKAKDKELLAVIRTIKSQIQLEEIKKKAELSDDDIISIIGKQIKLRKDGIEEFKKASRDDLAEQYLKEIKLLEVYMPKQLTEDEITSIVTEVIEKTKATSMKDMGSIMKELMPLVKGKADMKIVNELIKSKLSN